MEIIRTLVMLSIFGLLGLLSVLAIARMLKIQLAEVHRRRAGLPYVPLEDPHPAAPVQTRNTVTVTAAGVLIWGVLHSLAISGWLATGAMIPRTATWLFAAGYAGVAALVSGFGALQLLRGRAQGRKCVAWGEFLFGILAFLLIVASATLPGNREAPKLLQQHWMALTAGFAVHLMIDVVLGAAAQRVGRPPGWVEAEEEYPAEEVLPPIGQPLEQRDMF